MATIASSARSTAKSSFRRKAWRDLSGQTGRKFTKAAWKRTFARYREDPVARRATQGVVVTNALLLALLTALGSPALYLLWAGAWLTTHTFVTRLRSIAEHGGLTRSDDRRVTSHHVRQGWVARTLMVPYGIGWHLAHHVDSGIPFRNLRKFTEALEEDGYIGPEMTWPSYRALWKSLASG